MFQEIIEHLKEKGKYSDKLIAHLSDICRYWEEISEQTLQSLKAIVAKYQYENLKNLRDEDSETTHLEFWKDMMQFALSPALEDHDLDDEFMRFVEDFHEKVTHTYSGELSDDDYDESYEMLDRLFYTWISCLWQEAGGPTMGIPVCTVENNSTLMFYFNDFLYDNLSAYHDKWDDERIEGSAFRRKVDPIEIYARTTRAIRRKDQHVEWLFTREKERLSFVLGHNTTILSDGSKERTITHERDTSYDNSYEVAARYFIKKTNSLMNQRWRLVEK